MQPRPHDQRNSISDNADQHKGDSGQLDRRKEAKDSPDQAKSNTVSRHRRRRRKLLTVRTTLILSLSLIIALAAGVLMYWAHCTDPHIVLGAGGVFGGSVLFFDRVVDDGQDDDGQDRDGENEDD